MSLRQADEITGKITTHLDNIEDAIDELPKLLAQAYEGKAWVPMGCDSWDEYVTKWLHTDRLKLTRTERQGIVLELTDAGMTTRQIGVALGVNNATVHRDAVANATPRRVDVRSWRHKGGRKPANTVDVTRPGRWGNPYTVEDNGQDGAVRLYRAWLDRRPDLVAAARRELAGKDLACYCKPDEACHADVLLEVANGEEISSPEPEVIDGEIVEDESPAAALIEGSDRYVTAEPEDALGEIVADEPCYLNDARAFISAQYTKPRTPRDRGLLRDILLEAARRLEMEGVEGSKPLDRRGKIFWRTREELRSYLTQIGMSVWTDDERRMIAADLRACVEAVENGK